MSIAVIVKFNFKPEKVEEGTKLLKSVVGPSQQEEGCLSYDLYQSSDSNDLYYMIESWASKELWEQHLANPHLEGVARALEPCLQEKFSMEWAKKVS